ncbi:MAG TPA: coproporphyrinogen-III oxidase family protein [Candidatus Binatia bacterium]|nr:coproporphyrinogen-III oxidase family protein [Candidatus Binatia bacterium]
MLSTTFEPDAARVERIAWALRSVPRMAYSVPHVYPTAAPAYTHAPMAERPPLAHDQLRLYVHVPFCRYHCTFCYYAVRIGADAEGMARYVRGLLAELAWVSPGTPLSQLFVGGGTPTALSPDLLDALLDGVFARTTRIANTVHTVEASPETVTPEHVEVLRRHGIGRVSMGIQTLDDSVLDTVHRDQTRAEALAACDLLVDSGLIANVDLIYGLPGQSEHAFLADLRALAARGVPSVTLYSLRINERTPVTKAMRDADHFDLAGLMRWRAFVQRSAEDLGYTQTRWHTFKRLDSIARLHQRLPCFDEDMAGFQFGIGSSARSHLGYTIYRNHERIDAYLERIERGQSPVEEVFPLAAEDRVTQFIARTLGDGGQLVRSHYEATFGREVDEDFGELLDRLVDADLLEDEDDRITLSESGKLLYDVVTLAFYPQRAREWLASRVGLAAVGRNGHEAIAT